eukprot:GHVN01075940.1.p1 GENE.GHVN01075940.1~~GHVN01075940.1.p1  ORF type:complete len:598 (-),score=41.69 GHVN01075940.1:124-1917(-)
MSHAKAVVTKRGRYSDWTTRRTAALEEEVQTWRRRELEDGLRKELVQPTLIWVSVSSTCKKPLPPYAEDHTKHPLTPNSKTSQVSWASIVKRVSAPVTTVQQLQTLAMQKQERSHEPLDTLHNVMNGIPSIQPLELRVGRSVDTGTLNEQLNMAVTKPVRAESCVTETSTEKANSVFERVDLSETHFLGFKVASADIREKSSATTAQFLNAFSKMIEPSRSVVETASTECSSADLNSRGFGNLIDRHDVDSSGADGNMNSGRVERVGDQKTWTDDESNIFDGTVISLTRSGNMVEQSFDLVALSTRATSEGCSTDDSVGDSRNSAISDTAILDAVETKYQDNQDTGITKNKVSRFPETSPSECSERLTPGRTRRRAPPFTKQGQSQLISPPTSLAWTNVSQIDPAASPSPSLPKRETAMQPQIPPNSTFQFAKRFPDPPCTSRVVPEKVPEPARSWSRPPLMPKPRSPSLLVNPLNAAHNTHGKMLDANTIIMKPTVPWWADASSKYVNSVPSVPPRRRYNIATHSPKVILPLMRDQPHARTCQERDLDPEDPTIFGDNVNQAQSGLYSPWGSTGGQLFALVGALSYFHDSNPDRIN